MSYYLATIVIYFGVYGLGALALNLQIGLSGIANFGFIIFESAGAYAAAITSIGPASNGHALSETYFWGINLPFPLPLLAGALAGGLLALIMGPVTMRKMRRDYQAATMLAISIIATQVISNDIHIFNGNAGLAAVPSPLSGHLNVSTATYDWIYAGYAMVLTAIGYVICKRISMSPFGRSLRALRDDDDAAASIGKYAWAMKMKVFVAGGAIAGLAGALLVQYIGAWSPAAWQYAETFVLLQCVILGGIANDKGALLGAFVVGVFLAEAPSFLPAIGYPGLINNLQWILIGVVYIIVLWFRPQGLIPERGSLRLAVNPAFDALTGGSDRPRRLRRRSATSRPGVASTADATAPGSAAVATTGPAVGPR
ncbi:MAG TPA: branched-chain amino acid ABC transporter permease [Acidimicrobiales bacterium]|nr:branched-chain amino acid ABC transporter permease [Acidimicrobiales bacterium]